MKIGLLRYCAFAPLCRALLKLLMDFMSIAGSALLLRVEQTLATRIKPIFSLMSECSILAMPSRFLSRQATYA
jgi:hypothetical protein